MLRLFLAILLLVTGASAQLHTLGPGRDLNEAVNLSSFVLIKWMGGTENNVAGIDVTKNRLILAKYSNLGQNWLPQEVTLLGTLKEGVSRGAVLVLADTDGDRRKDLVLFDGDDAYIWTATDRFSSGPWTTPVHLKLPRPPGDG